MSVIRPDPIITWWLGDSFIRSAAHISHKVGNITRSVLTLTPRHGDDQRVLTCRAENTQISDGALQDAWKLTVYCEWPPGRAGTDHLGSDSLSKT